MTYLKFVGPRNDPLTASYWYFLENVCLQVSHFIDRKRDELRVRQFMTSLIRYLLSPDRFVVFNSEGCPFLRQPGLLHHDRRANESAWTGSLRSTLITFLPVCCARKTPSDPLCRSRVWKAIG